MRKRTLLIFLLILLLLPPLVLLRGYSENRTLHLNRITLSDPELPENFDGFRIAHVSDLHNAEFKENNEMLLALLRNIQPDIIAFTGDMIDSVDPHAERSLFFLREAASIAPCYYVTGNHEANLAGFDSYAKELQAAGITLLQGEAVMLERDGQQLSILGVDDYILFPGNNGRECVAAMIAQLEALPRDGFDVLLFHRPELTPELQELDIELILSGHAHGGQIRLPFIGGLFAPDQGFFPQYDSGVYDLGSSTMVLSRGLGNSKFPFRLNNPPEVILLTLEKE